MKNEIRPLAKPVNQLNEAIQAYLIENGSEVFKKLFREMSALDVYDRLDKTMTLLSMASTDTEMIGSHELENSLWIMKVLKNIFLELEKEIY